MTESEQIIYDQLVSNGWTVYHSGWPDFIAERDGDVQFIEVKGMGGMLQPNQKVVIDLLRNLGLKVHIFRAYKKNHVENYEVTEEDIRKMIREPDTMTS